MPAITFKPRVKETSTTTGTGSITLAGAVVGYQSFDDAFVVTDDYFYYCIEAVDGNGVPTGQWEEGIGHLSASTTLVRDTLLSSSTGSAVSFSAGTKNVFCTVGTQYFNIGPIILSTTSLDLNAAAATETTLYTVPTGKRCIVIGVVLDKPSAQIDTATWNVSWNGTTSVLMNAVSHGTALLATTKAFSTFGGYDEANGAAFIRTYDQHVGVAADALKFVLDIAEGSACTAIITVFGYLTDTNGIPVPGR